MAEAAAAHNGHLNQLNSILHKYWPTHVQKILVTLFSDSDPAIKHLAFSLLGREAMPESTPLGGRP